MPTITRADARDAIECRSCRAFLEAESSGDAEDLGESLSLGGTTEASLARHPQSVVLGSRRLCCVACFRTMEVVGTTLRIDIVRGEAPPLECARCANFLASCGGIVEPVRQHRRYVVKAPSDEPARSYGYGRLALDSLRCDRCARALHVVEDPRGRRVQMELFASEPATPQVAPVASSDAEARIDCARCRGFLREVAPAGLALADGGTTLAFAGGSAALLEAHFGAFEGDADRTCPDCRRQTHLTTEPDQRRGNGAGRMEITPGALGPLGDGCATCAPIVREAIARDRRLHLGRYRSEAYLPRTLWPLVASCLRVGRSGDDARCDACGRDARLGTHGALPLTLGVRARPDAALSRRPTLDCDRCAGFVSRADRAEVVDGCLALQLDPEPTYGPPTSHAPGRFSVTRFSCAECAREIRVEEDPAGWVTKVALARTR